MTITITLPPETEERLRAQAEATGKSISTLVVEAVEARLSLSKLALREILAPAHADFHRSGMTGEQLEELLQESLDETRSERRSLPGASA
ncbi:MAG: ribbon-helix-helix protein, CopG family [Planctomycetaceae bacterium]|nr:ribbon-helix-helix protein, CopG family [Planctomycetaceae bacterium]